MFDQSCKDYFTKYIGEGLAVPGLEGNPINEKIKLAWLKPLGNNIEKIYSEYPILETYIEYHRNTKNQHMTLQDRPYLLAILTDDAQEIVIKKSVQCGISEIALCLTYTKAREGLSIMYVLPAQPIRNRFVANRVDTQLARIPFYRSQVREAEKVYGQKASDARALKNFGPGTIHFVGSNTEGELSEFPADLAIIDEQDLCDGSKLPLVKDRLSESDYKRIWRISNPRKPNAPHNVGKVYNRSTANEWFIKCKNKKCKKEQTLDWFENFIERDADNVWQLRNKNGSAVCKHCGQILNRLGPGRWIPQNPKARISGYKISKLFTKSSDMLEIFRDFLEAQYDDTKLQIFYGSSLGEYYVSEGAELTVQDLNNCIDDKLEDWPDLYSDTLVMGVDVGSILHVKASILDEEGNRTAAFIGTVKSFEELKTLTNKLEPDCIVIDALPEIHSVAKFAAESDFDVWVCTFGDPEQTEPIIEHFDTEPKKITANRTAVFDSSFADIKRGKVILPPQAEFVDQYFDQMMVPKRQWDAEANKGNGRFIWTKGVDHYRLAELYEHVAAQMLDKLGIGYTNLQG